MVAATTGPSVAGSPPAAVWGKAIRWASGIRYHSVAGGGGVGIVFGLSNPVHLKRYNECLKMPREAKDCVGSMLDR